MGIVDYFRESAKERSTRLFEKFATPDAKGDKYLALDGFIQANAAIGYSFTNAQAAIMFQAADIENNGKLSIYQYLDFESIFSEPFPESRVLAKLISSKGNFTVGTVVDFFKKFTNPQSAAINFNAPPIFLHLGSDASRPFSVEELSSLIQTIKGEKAKAEFYKYDPKGTGKLNGADVTKAVASLMEYKLNPTLKSAIEKNLGGVTFSEFVALTSVLSKTNEITKVLALAGADAYSGLSPASFANYSLQAIEDEHFTPMEVKILFKIFNGESQELLNRSSFGPLVNSSYSSDDVAPEIVTLSAAMQTLKSIYNFGLGSVAGAIGATFVYPIGLSKLM